MISLFMHQDLWLKKEKNKEKCCLDIIMQTSFGIYIEKPLELPNCNFSCVRRIMVNQPYSRVKKKLTTFCEGVGSAQHPPL